MKTNESYRVTTPNVADACLRLGVPFCCAPREIRPLETGLRIAGSALPVVHHGSVDVFLEALLTADPDAILVVDNQGRTDEACIGDLVVLEAKTAGLAGIIIWGGHRDSAEVRALRFPLFSMGAWPVGPVRLDPRTPATFTTAQLGEHSITRNDYVFADDDGILVIDRSYVTDVERVADEIHVKEAEQAEAVLAGRTLREQFNFDAYLQARKRAPELTFRDHLRRYAAEIEVDWT